MFKDFDKYIENNNLYFAYIEIEQYKRQLPVYSCKQKFFNVIFSEES